MTPLRQPQNTYQDNKLHSPQQWYATLLDSFDLWGLLIPRSISRISDNITSYTEGPITEPATNQSPEVQSNPPIHFQALGIDAAAAQAEFDQDVTFIGEAPVADFTGE